MPAKSKAQQRMMGWAYACKTGKTSDCPPNIEKVSKTMSTKQLKKFAKTKRSSLKEGSIKSLVEGMTFTSFLIAEAGVPTDENTIRGFVRTLPQWQEMMSDPNVKPEALKLGKRLIGEFGDGPVDQRTLDYVFDEIDNLSSQHFSGSMMGDWGGEAEYQRKKDLEKDIEDVAKFTEPRRSTVRGGARTGMDFDPQRKAAQAAGDFVNMGSAEQAERIAAARQRARSVSAPRAGSKMAAAQRIFREMFGEAKPSEIIRRMMSEVGMSKPHATTYYYKFKKQSG